MTLQAEIEEYLVKARWDIKEPEGTVHVYKRGTSQVLKISYKWRVCTYLYNSVVAIRFDKQTFEDYIKTFIKYI